MLEPHSKLPFKLTKEKDLEFNDNRILQASNNFPKAIKLLQRFDDSWKIDLEFSNLKTEVKQFLKELNK